MIRTDLRCVVALALFFAVGWSDRCSAQADVTDEFTPCVGEPVELPQQSEEPVQYGEPLSVDEIYAKLRKIMVEEAVIGSGIKDERVIQSMGDTPRHEFVPKPVQRYAYNDGTLLIGGGQTISPPSIVAYMTEQLDPKPTDRVLEIGTGSGYQAAVLSPLVDEVYTIEIVEQLGRHAAAALKKLDYENVHPKVGDGYKGWPEHAPFDKIIVTCSPENVPKPLVEQLKEGGRMIIPIGERFRQVFYLYTKKDGKLIPEPLKPTLFVPMTGQAETLREVQPDGSNPELENTGFEVAIEGTNHPDSWYVAWLCKRFEEKPGNFVMRFENSTRGRSSQIQQGLAVDGREVSKLRLSCRVTCDDVRHGFSVYQTPAYVISFYDKDREHVADAMIGPWKGTFDWRTDVKTIKVPPNSREAFVLIGMFGATGTLMLDDVKLEPVEE